MKSIMKKLTEIKIFSKGFDRIDISIISSKILSLLHEHGINKLSMFNVLVGRYYSNSFLLVFNINKVLLS